MYGRARHLFGQLFVSIALLSLIAGCDSFTSPQTRFERAQEHVAEGDYRTALVELKNALQKQPDLHEARLLLAEVVLWLGDPQSAEVEFLKLSAPPGAARTDELATRIDLALGRSQVVLNRLEGTTSIPPAKKSYYRGMALQGLDQLEPAEQEFRAAAAQDPKLIQARVGIVDVLVARGKLTEALQLTTALVAEAPDSAFAWYGHGTMLAQKGDKVGALEALRKAAELSARQLEVPQQAAALAALSQAQLANGDKVGARASSDTLAKLLPGSPLGLVVSSRVAMATDDYATAVSDLRRAVNASPDFAQARFLLAVGLLAQDNLQQASAELRQVVDRNPEYLEARQLLAQVQMRMGDPDGAMALLIPALQASNEDRQLTALANAASMRAGAPKTIERLKEALQQAPGNQALQMQLAATYLQAQQPQAAVDTLNQLLQADPNDDAARLMLAEIEVARGRTAEGIAHLEQLRKKDPKAAHPRLLLARLALGRDDATQAGVLVEELLKADPSRTELHNAAGMLYLTSGRYDQAASLFQRGTVADPKNAPAWLNLGRAQLALGQKGTARESLERALSLQPNWVSAEGILAFMELQSGDRAAAIQRVTALRQALPKDPAAIALDGEIRMAMRDYPAAATAFAEAYAAQPTAPLAAKTYEARLAAKLPKAEETLADWVKQRPEDRGARALLAEAYTRSSQNDLAIAEYEAVLEKSPKHPPTLNNLAYLLHQKGDNTRAIELARQAVALAPSNAAVADTLGWILVDVGQVAEGATILREAAKGPKAPAEIRYHYAVALARSGDRQQARTLLEGLVKETGAFPSRPAAEQLLRELSTNQAAGEGG